MRTGKGRPLTTLSVSQTLTKVERINPNISGKEQPGRSWSRAKRETTGQHGLTFHPTPAGVTDQMPSGVNPSATAAAVGHFRAIV